MMRSTAIRSRRFAETVHAQARLDAHATPLRIITFASPEPHPLPDPIFFPGSSPSPAPTHDQVIGVRSTPEPVELRDEIFINGYKNGVR